MVLKEKVRSNKSHIEFGYLITRSWKIMSEFSFLPPFAGNEIIYSLVFTRKVHFELVSHKRIFLCEKKFSCQVSNCKGDEIPRIAREMKFRALQN